MASKPSILPAVQTLGSLDPHTFLLELPTYSRPQLVAAMDGSADVKPACVVGHELYHWFDIVGSVWGQSYIDVLFNTYDQILAYPLPDIRSYPAALRLFDTDREILFPSYYKFVSPGAGKGGPGVWDLSFTTGTQIMPDGRANEDHPILFVRFGNAAKEVARQPVTVGALLELRAIESELSTVHEISESFDMDAQTVTRHLFGNELVSMLYDPQLTTYSVGAHLLAHSLQESDGAISLRLGSFLADICLNLTPRAFQRLKTPSQWQGALPRRRLEAFRTRKDVGFAYACLSILSQTLNSGADLGHNLLRAAGLPDVATIYDDAAKVLSRPPRSLPKDPDLARIRSLLQTAGSQIFDARKRTGGRFYLKSWSSLPTPVAMTADLETFSIGRATLSEADVELLTKLDRLTREATRQALRAGRGLEFQFSDFVY